MNVKNKISSKKTNWIKENLIPKKKHSDLYSTKNSSVNQLLNLQQKAGNQAVQRLLESGIIQPKLIIGKPGDKYELEADRIAEQAMHMRDVVCPTCAEKKGVTVQSKGAHPPVAEISPDVKSSISSLKGKGEPLSESARNYFEPRFGYDFSKVRVHTGNQSVRSAHSIHSKAFTAGKDIVFNKGYYSPDTEFGRNLLAHELVHTLQQSAVKRSSDLSFPEVTPHLPTIYPLLQRKADCNLYVYDSTQRGALGAAWRGGTKLWAAKAWGGYAVPSGATIVTMLSRMLNAIEVNDCNCVEEIQFWCHGTDGMSMYISESERFTVHDFYIRGFDTFKDGPDIDAIIAKYGTWSDTLDALKEWYKRYYVWKAGLPLKSRLLLSLREKICDSGAEVWYRSCETFQGETGKTFAKEAAEFWNAKVIGHTHVIGLSQPGKQELEPGEKPTWGAKEGVGEEDKHAWKTALKVLGIFIGKEKKGK